MVSMENPPQLPLFILAYFLLLLTASCSVLRRNETDRLALLAFRAEITRDPEWVVASWNDSLHFCQWWGVTCGRKHERVTRLELQSLQLSGSISPYIGNLSFLKVLDLRFNSFSGHIPLEVGHLFRLEILNLQSNSFSGKIPRNISGCSNLSRLSLGSNTLVGKLPTELGLLSKLMILSLSNNSLVGEILPSLGNLSSLEVFTITINNFQGSIPESFGQLRRLNTLYLGANKLSGQVPVSIYNITSLKNLSFPVNQLQGSLPQNLAHLLPNVEMLRLHTNQLHGPIPISISNASKLSIFSVSNNQFTGKVPVLANLYSLQDLGLSNNVFTNDDLSFLSPLVNYTNLETLQISDNNFGGILPEYISNFSTKLAKMTIARNQIRGKIPREIGNLINLEALGMETNQLTGTIPGSIGKLQKLQSLFLNGNRLVGAIPPSIGNLTMLIRLNLRENNLEGSIPPSIGQCQQLLEMSLALNNLNGSIPKEVFVTSLFAFDWYENHLIGPIPMEVSKLVNLNYMNISKNKLSGELPNSLGSCIRLETLALSGNMIRGTTPQSLSSLRGIQILDLSQNNLSGEIPEYFESFQVLEYLNLSFNNFDGELPMQGVFKNASKFSVTGNLRLCGGIPELKLSSCKSNQPKKLSPKLKLFVIIAGAIIGLISMLAFAALFWLRKKRSMLPPSLLQPSSLQLSYNDLFKATNGFAPSNLIGKGGFGSVYRGILDPDEMVVAVKVFNLQYRGSFKSFMAECEALRNIRHRNLVKSLTVCSSIDFQGNDFMALVYEFMVNGSLEDWLYPVDGSHQGLNLMQRLNIAIEVASALEYLHNQCHIKIVHCDLKPSNILLDGDMTAHIGDFGLARIIHEASEHLSLEQTSSIGLRGSIGYTAPGTVVTNFFPQEYKCFGIN